MRCRRGCPVHTRRFRRRLRELADAAHVAWAARLVVGSTVVER